MTDLKWTIYSVSCDIEKRTAIDEALEMVDGDLNDKIEINESIRREIEEWKKWDGIHKISYRE